MFFEKPEIISKIRFKLIPLRPEKAGTQLSIVEHKILLNMTKAEIVAEISTKTGIEKVDVQETVEAFFSVVKSSMIGGKNLYVRGFGSFVLTKRAEKKGRNISKNTTITIPEHTVPTFKPAKVFIEKVKKENK